MATETFDAAGQATNVSVSDTKSTLEQADDQKFTLRIESSVDVAGKRITAAPQTVVQRYDGAPADQKLAPGTSGSERVLIDSIPYSCDILQLETTGPMTRTLTKTFYCKTLLPYVLRRETITTNLQSNVVVGHTTMEAIALAMPTKVRDTTLPASHFKATQQHEKGTNVTLLVTSFEVPGGVVSHTSKELDIDNRVVRRSTLELLDFGDAPPAAIEAPAARRSRLFRRNRVRGSSVPVNRNE